jgi:hypothetical protein
MKLQTCKVQSKSEFDKEVVKQQLVYRVGNWLEHYIERYLGNHDGDIDDAIEQAQEDLKDPKTFETIDEQSELIDVDPLDDFEGYKYQAELIKVMDLQEIYRNL